MIQLAALALAGLGCATAALPVEAGFGPTPVLPPPDRERLPQVEVAPARPWPDGAAPVAAAGTRVARFAEGLDHPRWLLVLPNGDVLVAETNAPERPLRAELMGVRGWLMGWYMKRSGAATPSADRITLLRDGDGDGRAELRFAFAEHLHSPFGMALVGDELFVANTDALVRFPVERGATAVAGPATKVADLPGGPLNHHWTKGLLASKDGRKLYVSVGSNSNVAEHGIEYEAGRASIWEIDRASGAAREYATGLRNPVGMAWQGDVLWAAVNERDEIGPDLVPDYMTSVREGGFYGWPYSYYGGSVDVRVRPQRLDLVAQAIRPDYALGAHTASLGLASARGSRLGGPFAPSGMFVGQHGSWNRRPPSGYKVLYVPFANGAPSGEPIDVLTGFLAPGGEAYGRPVGVAVARDGALLVADDVGNCVWRVAAGPR
ncbi:MAG TPA: sorbosone dehydrogenase family protein [Myxococcota bacterium]|nr:sorbosone dehydrogenase family protein [Myxococcota bacterium]